MEAMFATRLKIAAGMLTLGIALVGQIHAAEPPARSGPGSPAAGKPAAAISVDQFDKLRALIQPKPGGFSDVLWMTDLWQARQKAAAEGKPLLVWVGDGHPLGWT